MDILINQEFGLLTVDSYLYDKIISGRNRHYYLCKCKCGSTKIVHSQHLKTGGCQSCGCLRKTNMAQISRSKGNIKPGMKIGKLSITTESIPEIRKNTKKYYIDCICECGRKRTLSTSYLNSKDVVFTCGKCGKFINGQRVSNIQKLIYQRLDSGTINYKYNKYCIDIALVYNGKKVAIEYDSWYWHRKLQVNKNRDKTKEKLLLDNNWYILYIQSKRKVPSKTEIINHLDRLNPDNPIVKLTMDDWE